MNFTPPQLTLFVTDGLCLIVPCGKLNGLFVKKSFTLRLRISTDLLDTCFGVDNDAEENWRGTLKQPDCCGFR
jgi:hypothetical protein